MPRGDGTGPVWGGGPGAGRGGGRCLGSRSSIGPKSGGSRVERYFGLIEMLAPLASTLMAMFKKPKGTRNDMGASTRVAVETDDSRRLLKK